jgi:hypothetical protein
MNATLLECPSDSIYRCDKVRAHIKAFNMPQTSKVPCTSPTNRSPPFKEPS